ncbi:MAG TPA: nucleotide exchange factor GrpE [Vicinamibacterales bacterium]|nr:nucleotide exchange factor GrpE [Vicinamibacterales bacterium]
MADQTYEDQESQAASEASSVPDEVEELRRERDALQDRLLRTAAEFDNYRKRVERDRRELSEFAAADALMDMLPIIDNLERALQAPSGSDAEGLRKGVELIHRQMLELLRKRGAKPIEALGADFDPNIHQAVVHEPSDRHREGEIMEELQRGYRLGERLLRPSMVKVAKTP